MLSAPTVGSLEGFMVIISGLRFDVKVEIAVDPSRDSGHVWMPDLVISFFRRQMFVGLNSQHRTSAEARH